MMIRRIISLCLVVFTLLTLVSCESDWMYDKDWIKGKNSEQIQARYGKFDGHPQDIPDDGLYRDCICVYFLQIDKQTWDETLPNEKLYIVFDSKGIAQKVYKHVDEGG